MSTYENKLLLETREAAPTTFQDSVQGYARGTRFGDPERGPRRPRR